MKPNSIKSQFLCSGLMTGDNKKGAILSLDFFKAFDWADRGLIYQIMSRYNFDPVFIKWIKILQEKSKLKVILNGILGQEIEMERGVKQGCQIAMYLYIIYIEQLHPIQNKIKGI